MISVQGQSHTLSGVILCAVLTLMVLCPGADGQCSEHCQYGEDFCRPDTSDCLYGCNDGFVGKACAQQCTTLYCKACMYNNSHEVCTRCKDGHYGAKCENQCSRTCKNKKCDKYGRCMFGCKPYFHGDSCEHQRCTFPDCLTCAYTAYNSYCSKCVAGKYWNPYFTNCSNCSEHCIGGQLACNSTSGVCTQGCEARWYGYLCDKYCSLDNCDTCTEVFHGTQKVMECAVCEDGYFRSHGRCEKCSVNCHNNASCNGQTGTCIAGCTEGWYGNMCSKLCQIQNCKKCEQIHDHIYCEICQNGFYWSSTDSHCLLCPAHCKNGCNILDGSCIDGCQVGYYGTQCDSECGHCASVPCDDQRGYCPQGCEEGWFGRWCMSSCPIHCRSCTDYNDGICGACEAGWYGPQCESKCSDTCQRNSFNNFLYCDQDTGVCTDGCRPSYAGQFCNVTCNENCFADLCNISTGNCTRGCKANFYGSNCDQKCSINCFPATKHCDPVDGKCLAGCRPGFYGEYCSSICSSTCMYGACDAQGNCASGCIVGYFGSTCPKACSSNCLNKICHPVTGYCTNGCQIGVYGSQCDVNCTDTCLESCKQDLGFCLGCKAGYYGNRCEHVCKYCYSNTCEQATGVCTRGCVMGRTGTKCDSPCPAGYFGRNCKEACSNCKDNSQCDAVNGTCPTGCVSGWTGTNCQRKSPRIVHYTQAVDSEKSTIAISTSATIGILLTLVVIVVGAVCHRRRGCPAVCSLKKKTDGGLQLEQQTYLGTTMRKTSVDGSNQSASPVSSPPSAMLRSLTIDPADLQLETTEMRGLFYMVRVGTLHHAQTQSTVMVKVLCKATQKRVQPDFLRDVEVVRTLDLHSNILSYIGLCQNERFIHSVFELCGCGDLKKYLTNLKHSSSDPVAQTVQLCYSELVKFVVDILHALIFLRNNKIIHRLVGSHNVYLDNDYTAKLANFHFAVRYREEDRQNGGIRARKLPHRYMAWMPPEARQEDSYSHNTDMWGIGVLLWEVVTLGNGTNIQDVSGASSPGAESADKITDRSTAGHSGYLKVPNGANRFLCQCIEQCWTAVPENRPSLTPMVRKLSASLSRRQVDSGEIQLTVSTLV